MAVRDPRERRREQDHGAHTLKVWRGVVVGVHGDDVFVELGPRMQGVISRRRFAEVLGEPVVGQEHEFTLHGQEEGLWALSPAPTRSLRTWEEMEVGSQVQVRVVRPKPGGLEVKIGPLHAFLPKSQSGLPREQDLGVLVGRTIACEVTEVDRERQRVVVSRKLVQQREGQGEHGRQVASLQPGQVVQARVSRVERYGAFVRFGRGLEGLVHVSDIAHERVEDAREALRVGQAVDAVVLHVKRGGRRIGLGLKQMDVSPWLHLEKVFFEGQIVEGTVTRVRPFGAFVAVRPGVEGLLHRSQTDLPPQRSVREAYRSGQVLSVRIVSLDVENERLALSALHPHGAPIAPDEAARARDFAELAPEDQVRALGTSFGALLREAIEGDPARGEPPPGAA